MTRMIKESGGKKSGGNGSGRQSGLLRRLLLLAAAVFLFEILIGNYSSVRSLFYKKTDLTDRMKQTWNGGGGPEAGPETLTVEIDGLNMRIDNLHFDLDVPENEVVSIEISLIDEGNRYPYPLPVMEAAGRYPSSFYTNLYPYGKVRSLSIEMKLMEGGGLVLQADRADGGAMGGESPVGQGGFALRGMEANVRRPFDFVIPRMLLLFGAGAFWIISGEGSGIYRVRFNAKSRRQNLITAGFLGLFVLLGLGLVLSNRACVESPWEHHQQYRQLAAAILDGHVWVGQQPELMELKNPYDTSYLLANAIPYLADYAYYEGKYYVYFGIVPELLFYLPCLALTGRAFPNFLAVWFCFAGFAVSVFGLYREAVKRWFPRIPYVFYLMAAGVTLTFGSFVYLAARPDLYHVPLMAANMFTAAGIWLWLGGLNRERGRLPLLFAGSLCMALVAGCRPQMLIFSILALPLFGRRIWKEKRVREAAALLVPYAAVAAGIMWYNALRFSSPFDFGAAYSLTNNDMTHRGTNLSRILYGLYAFFFQPPHYEGAFPFLMSNDLNPSYMGKMVSEFLYGGILASQTVCWCLALLPACRKRIIGQSGGRMESGCTECGIPGKTGEGRELWGIFLCAVTAPLIIGGFDANAAGILQRYMADAAFGFAFASCLMLLWLFGAAQGTARRIGLVFLRVSLLQHALYAFLVVFACGDSVNLKNYGRILYYGAKRLFQM